MKKVLIAQELHAFLEQDKTFLDRTDIKVFAANTNEDILKVHRAEKADLIITQLDMPGMTSDRLCTLIREDANLRNVSLIMVCANTPEAIRESSRCRANAVLLRPLHPVLLMAKAQQLLDIAARETLRVLLSANVDSLSSGGSFYCRTRNISATGMMIETDNLLEEGARLSCQFYLPNAKKIETSGKIIRIIQETSGAEDYQYGLMFTDITPEAKQQLIDFVESRSNKSSHAGS